jgi:hypothetical protein
MEAPDAATEIEDAICAARLLIELAERDLERMIVATRDARLSMATARLHRAADVLLHVGGVS